MQESAGWPGQEPGHDEVRDKRKGGLRTSALFLLRPACPPLTQKLRQARGPRFQARIPGTFAFPTGFTQPAFASTAAAGVIGLASCRDARDCTQPCMTLYAPFVFRAAH